jgi:GNAT superfamily N-acetyltransferase
MSSMSLREITSRPYDFDRDFWRVRALLSATYPLAPLGFNWEIRRWDGWHFHRAQPLSPSALAQRIRVWESTDGALVGAAHAEGSGDLSLQLHPDHRALEDEMVAWGEEILRAEDDGQRRLDLFVFDDDHFRRDLLAQRGYEVLPYGGVMRRARLDAERHSNFPGGYTLRPTLRDPHDDWRAAALLNAAFERTIHSAAEYAAFAAHSPSYDPQLDLVAQAPDGSFAAMVSVSLDSANRLAIVEPVCTHPDHRRKGLARALIDEGLRRAQALGITAAILGTGDDPGVNALYQAVGFTEVRHGTVWRKVW